MSCYLYLLPTPYLSFLSALLGTSGAPDAATLSATSLIMLLAVSVGAVFFGANTYIGNGPNFMVKAIADHQKVQHPHLSRLYHEIHLAFHVADAHCGMAAVF